MAPKRLSKKKKKKKTKYKRERKSWKIWLDLPSDLLQLVMSRLPLKDKIRVSAVCKTWHKACASFRVSEKSPWLIYSNQFYGSYQLYDPSMHKRCHAKFPELYGSRVCYSKDGWLLMYKEISFQELFFFNPFTLDCIPVPPLWMAFNQRMAFSCAPTSTSCLLFTVSLVTLNDIYVKTCCPNAKEWNTFEFRRNGLPKNYTNFEHIVFSNGVFYCLTDTGCLTIFDPSLNSWKVLPGRPPKRPGSNGCFMTEHQGEIFLIYIYIHMNPTVLKLDHTNWEWTRRKTLGGLTIYTSALSSESRAEQKQSNCLCFSVFNGCVYYKVDEESKLCFTLKKRDTYPHQYIWIMPPLDLPPLFDQL